MTSAQPLPADSPGAIAPGEARASSNAPELTVYELAGALKRPIEDAYGRVKVRGELGRVTIAKSGHVYADLKDDRAVIATVMWKGSAARLSFRPEEGLEVVIDGRLSTYPGRSQYQLIADSMAPAGVGALMALLEARKAKLAEEGLFAAERKARLPYLPRVLGVVTSPTGAVIRDILHRITDRYPMRVLVWPVLVQGEQAADQVAAAIHGFNGLTGEGDAPRPDTLIVARGGGSLEDLWAFNEEQVVRAAALSSIPLISAVGHETDWTLLDLAADVRAPTPTGAAEMAVPVRADLVSQVNVLGGRLVGALGNDVERRRSALRAAVRGLPRPDDLLGLRSQRLDAVGARLRSALKGATDNAAIRFQRLSGRLQPQALARDVTQRARRVDELAERSARDVRRGLEMRARSVAALSARLEALNPKAVLGRGYALVQRADGSLARSSSALRAKEAIMLEFADGRRSAVVDSQRRARRAGKRNKDDGQGSLF